MKTTKWIIFGALIAAAVLAAADGVITTQNGDLKLFGQGQTTYGLGVSTEDNYPKLNIIGDEILWIVGGVTNAAGQLIVAANGTGNSADITAASVNYLVNNINYAQITMRHANGVGSISTAAGGSGVAGDVQIFGQAQQTRGIAVSDDGTNPLIKSTTGDIEFQPAGGDVHMNANGLSMKTPNGNWACCNPDDAYNWKCTPGKCT